MGWTISKRQRAVRSLIDQRLENQKLELDLRIQGKDAEAKSIREANQRLSDEIDELIGKCMEEWGKDAETNTAAIKEGREKIKATIKEIKQGIEVAKNVVKAVGYIDDLVNWAKKLA